MYLSKDASKLRQREAQNARDNRAEIVKALSQGQITKRDLIKWGIYTTGGMLVAKHGLSVYAPSALGKGGTAAPRTPLFGAQKFTEKFSRLRTQTPTPLTPRSLDANGNRLIGPTGKPETHADFLPGMKEHSSKRLSYHSDFTAQMKAQPARNDRVNKYRNPVTNEGPMEGRPPGEMFSHQRWDEFFPKQAYVTSISSCAQPDTLGHGGSYFHDRFPHQAENSVWCYGAGQKSVG